MWKITLIINVIFMLVFWFLAEVIISPTYNLLIQYAEVQIDLPIITQWAIEVRPFLGIMPLIWFVLTVMLGMKLTLLNTAERNELVILHVVITLLVGLLMLSFYILAAELPFLKIAALLN